MCNILDVVVPLKRGNDFVQDLQGDVSRGCDLRDYGFFGERVRQGLEFLQPTEG